MSLVGGMSYASQLTTAILNLALNARDAMPDGGTLTIGAHAATVAADHPARLSPGDYVRITVADTGIGMDEATLSRAIEPFFSTKGIGKGTGLGLSMVHGLASQLGGAMQVASKPGLGTLVELLLPVADGDPAMVQPAQNAADNRASVGSSLLVDDEPSVRATTRDLLEDLGYEVTEVGSAAEALTRLREDRVDIIVTDHLMPGMTGAELAREVRRRSPGTKVLLVSGYAELESVSPDMPRLAKPFRQQELATSLAQL